MPRNKPLTISSLWTRAEVVARLKRAGLKVSERTLARMAKDNDPPDFPQPVKIRGRVYYKVSAVEIYCRTIEEESGGAA